MTYVSLCPANFSLRLSDATRTLAEMRQSSPTATANNACSGRTEFLRRSEQRTSQQTKVRWTQEGESACCVISQTLAQNSVKLKNGRENPACLTATLSVALGYLQLLIEVTKSWQVSSDAAHQLLNLPCSFRKHFWLNLKMTFPKRWTEQAGNGAGDKDLFTIYRCLRHDCGLGSGLYLSVLPQTAGNGINNLSRLF